MVPEGWLNVSGLSGFPYAHSVVLSRLVGLAEIFGAVQLAHYS